MHRPRYVILAASTKRELAVSTSDAEGIDKVEVIEEVDGAIGVEVGGTCIHVDTPKDSVPLASTATNGERLDEIEIVEEVNHSIAVEIRRSLVVGKRRHKVEIVKEVNNSITIEVGRATSHNTRDET